MKKQAFFNYDFALELTEDQAESGSHSGNCYNDVKELLKLPEVLEQFESINPESIRKELKEYGAWNEAELSNDEENRIRILWIACANIREESNV